MFIICIDADGYRQRDAVESRRPMLIDGFAQEEGIVWRHGGVDGRPGKVDASAFALKMDRWKMAAAASESVSDRFAPYTRQLA